MATLTALLRSELMSHFFDNATIIRATLEHTGPGLPTITQYAENTLPFEMTIFENVTNGTDVVAQLVPFNSEEFILIRLETGYASAEVKKLEFIGSDETVYFEWNFSAGEVVYTGNGELHIEAVNFKVA